MIEEIWKLGVVRRELNLISIKVIDIGLDPGTECKFIFRIGVKVAIGFGIFTQKGAASVLFFNERLN